MRMRARVFAGILVAACIGLIETPVAHAGVRETFDFKNGNWRLELSGFAALRSGNRSRTGDIGSSASVEYEVPMTQHATFGLKAYPLFVFDQDDSGEDTLVGAAFGPEFRFYTKKEEYRGFFFEIGSALLGTSGKIDGNSATFNLLNEGGVGYKFKNDWHISFKISHISNAGLADSNSGVNSLGLAIGHTFSRLRRARNR